MESYDLCLSTYALELCDELYTLANLPSLEHRVKYDKVLSDIASSKNILTPVLSGRDKFLHEKYNLGMDRYKYKYIKPVNSTKQTNTKMATCGTILNNIQIDMYDFIFSVFIITLVSYIIQLFFIR